jgi:hypothetical protein
VRSCAKRCRTSRSREQHGDHRRFGARACSKAVASPSRRGAGLHSARARAARPVGPNRGAERSGARDLTTKRRRAADGAVADSLGNAPPHRKMSSQQVRATLPAIVHMPKGPW